MRRHSSCQLKYIAAAVATGATLLIFLTYTTIKHCHEDDIRLILCCWLTVSMMVAVTVGRVIIIIPDTILHARYNFFSVMLILPLSLWFLKSQNRFKTGGAYIAIALAFFYSMNTLNDLDRVYGESNFLYKNYNKGVYAVATSKNSGNSIVKEAIARGIYISECRPYPTCKGNR